MRRRAPRRHDRGFQKSSVPRVGLLARIFERAQVPQLAEEIRQLSEQTNEASNRITNIIAELTTEADKAMAAIDKTVESVEDQNKLIDETEAKFTVINENVDELVERFNDIGESMDAISSSTVEINDSISNLSATSEEVASLSSEGETSSAKAVEKFAELNDLLRMIYDEAQKLK